MQKVTGNFLGTLQSNCVGWSSACFPGERKWMSTTCQHLVSLIKGQKALSWQWPPTRSIRAEDQCIANMRTRWTFDICKLTNCIYWKLNPPGTRSEANFLVIDHEHWNDRSSNLLFLFIKNISSIPDCLLPVTTTLGNRSRATITNVTPYI